MKLFPFNQNEILPSESEFPFSAELRKRLYSLAGHESNSPAWFARTREGTFGPYGSELEAGSKLQAYVEQKRSEVSVSTPNAFEQACAELRFRHLVRASLNCEPEK